MSERKHRFLRRRGAAIITLFTLVLSGIRNVGRMNRNEITGTQAVQEVLLDGGTRAGLAVVGNYVGVGVGLLVFGPAGALVLGAVAPIVSQRQSSLVKGKLDEWVKDATYRAWADEARHALSGLIARAQGALKQKAALLQARQPDNADAAVVHYLRWRTDDQLGFLREAWCRLQAIAGDKASAVEILMARLMGWLSTSTLHPTAYQAELDSLSKVLKRRPSTTDRIAVVAEEAAEKTLQAAKDAKKALGEWWNGLSRANNNKRKH